MPDPDLSKIRNIGIIAHIDAGKTTTTEHILYYSGAKHKLGGVDEGTTDTDYDPEEQDRGITIYSACIPFRWRDCQVNLIDTPGHVDFTAEVERSLRVLDGAVVVFDAQNGVEAQSETVWRQADKYKVPRLVFANKMDVVGADFDSLVQEVAERLEGHPAPINIPIGSGGIKDSPHPFRGIIDLIEMKAIYYDAASNGKTFRTEAIPPEKEADARRWRDNLFEILTKFDDKDLLTSNYLEGKPISSDAVHQVLREQTVAGRIQPMLCGSGREHIGVQPLMDSVARYLPSPIDRPPVTGQNPNNKNKEEQRKPDPKEPFAGLVFKVVADTHGDLYYLRVYSGALKANSRVWNPVRKAKEFASKLYHILADPRHRDELPTAPAGEIVAIIGPKDSITGDTLCDPQHPIILEQIQFAEAVVSQSVEPESSADKDKLTEALDRLRREDPTFTYRVDTETGQTLMSGMGLLHLEVKTHRLERDFRLKVRVSKPRVSYRETLKQARNVEGECIIKRQATAQQKQTGGGLFAKVSVRFEAVARGQGIKIENRVTAEGIPGEFLVAAEQGIKDALHSGELGYPVIDVRAAITAVQIQEGLSNEVAFQAAGADAVHRALKDNIILLEPVMHSEITVPEDYLGPVSADLNARRAEITQVHSRGKLRVIEALAPLAKMFDYSDKVRSLSQGRASWTMQPKAYAPVSEETMRTMFGSDNW